MKKILFLCMVVMMAASTVAKPAYTVTMQVDGSKDSMLVMGYYHAQHRLILDTAYNNGKGKFVFEGKEVLHPGLYFITNNNDRFVEFVVYREKPHLAFRTDQRNWIKNIRAKGSYQNEVFFNYKRATIELYEEMMEARRTLDSAAFQAFNRRQFGRMDSLNIALYAAHPDAMVAKMIYATKRVDDEVPTQHADGTPMSDRERYDYFMAHYFDHIPLDDDFIVNTPKEILYQRVTDYIDKYMRGLPPSEICPRLDTMIDRAERAPRVYQWLINSTTEKFLQSNVMAYDEVYVHLVQRYFETGKVTWLAPSVIDEQVEQATKWDRLLIGRVAPELVLFDTLRHVHSLYRTRGQYTLLLFWSPTCGHCREVIPAVYEVFQQYADSLGLSAFAVLTEPSEGTTGKWKEFLKSHGMTDPRWINMSGGEANIDWREVYDITTTPQIYLIENKDHKIVAKKLNAKLLSSICGQLLHSKQ